MNFCGDRALRIVLVSQEFPPHTAHGGIATQTYEKAQGLAARGHEVHVISHSWDAVRHEYREGAVSVMRIPSADSRLEIHTDPVRWLSYSLEVACAIGALHARRPIELLDFPEWGAEGYVHLLNRTPWHRIPSVVQLHGPLVMVARTLGWPEPGSEWYRVGTAMEAACLRLADAVYASSRCSADWCARHYGLDFEHVPIIHTGVDTRAFRPLDVPKAEHLTIIFVGRLAASKGAEILVEACCRLAESLPCLRLRMVGRGEPAFIARLEERARRSGHPGLLQLPGFVEHRELPKLLCDAHIFAAPSSYEGGPGFVYLEAMACGLPVIACEGSGAAEIITDGVNGMLVPPGDVEALVEILRELCSDSHKREEAGREARRFVVGRAERDVCLDRLEAFYRRTVDATTSAARSQNRAE